VQFSYIIINRGHPYKLYKPRTYNTVRASYFSIRIVNVWNSLPADRVDFSSFASFKRTVEQIDFYSVFIMFSYLTFIPGLLSVS